jgi:hypothetical protein
MGVLLRLPALDLGFVGELSADDNKSRALTDFRAPFLWVCTREGLGTGFDSGWLVVCKKLGHLLAHALPQGHHAAPGLGSMLLESHSPAVHEPDWMAMKDAGQARCPQCLLA